MPAPTRKVIENNLKEAYLSAGFSKYQYVNGVLTPVPGELPEEMMKLIKAQAAGIAQTWSDWQATQTVVIPVTSVAGTPSVGRLP